MRVIVTTSDTYLWALRPLAFLMDRYWRHQRVVVGGFSEPEFETPFEFHSIGKMDDYPINKWSDALIKLLLDIPDEVVLLMLEDMWPVRTVNREAIKILYDYMQQFEYVAKIDLCADRLYAHGMRDYGHAGCLDLVISMPGSPYHLSLMPGLWRKEHLLKALVPGETPWEVELNGTVRLSHDRDVIVLGTRQWPLKVTLAFRGGDFGKLLLDDLDKADVEAMKEKGLLDPWKSE